MNRASIIHMPQVQLPLFPSGATLITPGLAFERRDNQAVYFNGHLPVFAQGLDDLGSVRMFTNEPGPQSGTVR